MHRGGCLQVHSVVRESRGFRMQLWLFWVHLIRSTVEVNKTYHRRSVIRTSLMQHNVPETTSETHPKVYRTTNLTTRVTRVTHAALCVKF